MRFLRNLSVKLESFQPSEQQWVQFIQKYKKNYSYGDKVFHRSIFNSNLELINEHNKKFDAGLSSYKMGVNKFADVAIEHYFGGLAEMKPTTTTLKPSQHFGNAPQNLPTAVDWRLKNAVTSVKNQGKCGSCWAFSAIGSLEGQIAIKTKNLVSLSAQNLIDCSWRYGNKGCENGNMINAYEYIKDNGITTEDKYPYRGKLGKCQQNSKESIVKLLGYEFISPNEKSLQIAVATIGPVSIGLFANNKMLLYKSGIFDENNENNEALNHAALVVGYGTEESKDYWLVKNSWGEQWGDKGYIKMSRNENNQNGVASFANYPIL